MSVALPLTPDVASSAADAFVGYAYSYPHKTAYRALPEAVELRDAWRGEDQGALALYVHLPFCAVRCGFCNLFTARRVETDFVEAYLDALSRQVVAVSRALPRARYGELALGGGTPTYLTERQLARLFDELDVLGVRPGDVPCSVETSPLTATDERLSLLRERGVERISLGVQSFSPATRSALGRPEPALEVERALERIVRADLSVLNIDLIYGADGQRADEHLADLERALSYDPEEIFLYPLYVRPGTGLGRRGDAAGSHRLELLRRAHERLVDAGYAAHSMRLYRKHGAKVRGSSHRCQVDGMVGLGCGARSYTASLHYADPWAVSQPGIRDLVADYVARDEREHGRIRHGFSLDPDEQRRRFVIRSLLHVDGLDAVTYRALFEAEPQEHLPELRELLPAGLATEVDGRWRLTRLGVERSDRIGPWLYSPRVRALMQEYVPR